MNRILQIIQEGETQTISKQELLENQEKLKKVLDIVDNSNLSDFEYSSRTIKPVIDYAQESLAILGKFRAEDISNIIKQINPIIKVKSVNFKSYQTDVFKHIPGKETPQTKEWHKTLNGTSHSIEETAHYLDITVNSANEFINYAQKISVVGDPRIKLDINVDPYSSAGLSKFNPHIDPRELDLSDAPDNYQYQKLYARR